MSLAGRTALVTGGSRGIGKAIALELAKAGADVAITYLQSAEKAAQVLSALEETGVRAASYRYDAADAGAAVATVDRAASELGGLDILVHNAGVQGPLCHVAETTVDDLRSVMEANFYSAFHLTQAVLPHLKKRPRSDLIFISTSGTKHRRDIGLPYDVSKKALEAMAHQYAAGLSQWGVRVNVVSPSMVDTDMSRGSLRQVAERMKRAGGEEATNSEFLKPASEFPFGRILRAEEVGKVCVFLCSEGVGYMSGQVLYLDGGAEWT